MNNILAACLLSSLIACTLDDPYMPVNPEEKTGSSCGYGVSACRFNDRG